jgi:hypothetical protein
VWGTNLLVEVRVEETVRGMTAGSGISEVWVRCRYLKQWQDGGYAVYHRMNWAIRGICPGTVIVGLSGIEIHHGVRWAVGKRVNVVN